MSGDQPSGNKQIVFSAIITCVSILITLVGAEFVLRLKNSDGQNYHIEMWKYSRDLKTRSDEVILGHEHVPSKSATLQNVEIRINERGMRGESLPEISPQQRRIMFLGSSATLGWGVEEDDVMTSDLKDMFSKDGDENVVIMNAGIGNYNAQRYANLFLTKNTDLNPTDIVVNYYVNDAEILEPGGGNMLIRNSELAITFWILANRFLSQNSQGSLLDHYKEIYQEDYQGYKDMYASLAQLADYAKENDIRLYLMMMPEVHDLEDYKYGFIHEKMAKIASDLGYNYIDALDAFGEIKDAQSLWAMPGDPHPNSKAHGIFAQHIYPVLKAGGQEE